MNQNKIAVVDVETTGLFHHRDFIVEIGIVLLNLETGEIEPIYDELVKETNFKDRHKDSWVFNNSDLKHQDVMNAKPLNISTLQAIFDEYHATAYNKDFDFDFLKFRGLKINELPCPMKILTDVCKIPHFYGYKYPKVQEAWDFLFGETDYIEKHRGCDDAKHEAKIIHELYCRGLWGVRK